MAIDVTNIEKLNYNLHYKCAALALTLSLSKL
jgi:hypothetical protein